MIEWTLWKNNIITNKQVEETGIKRYILASLVQKGELEQLKKDAYKKKDSVDDFATILLNNEQVVFSFHTAYILLDLATEHLIFFISVFCRDTM